MTEGSIKHNNLIFIYILIVIVHIVTFLMFVERESYNYLLIYYLLFFKSVIHLYLLIKEYYTSTIFKTLIVSTLLLLLNSIDFIYKWSNKDELFVGLMTLFFLFVLFVSMIL
jgi:hypothetical protein